MKHKCYLISLLLINCFVYSFAQKLPNEQQVSLRSPINLKLENKPSEWNTSFQAYNKKVELYYKIANDDNNLYLLIKADGPRIIQKILAVGVTFTINNNGIKKENAESIIVNYPNIPAPNARSIAIKIGADIALPGTLPMGYPDTTFKPKNRVQIDSLIQLANQILISGSKSIRVKGVSEIPDTEISIYNEYSIKAISLFNSDRAFVYQLSFPLEKLKLSASNGDKLTYSIKLRNRMDEPKNGMRVRYYYPDGVMTDADQDLDSTTEFWSEYTLAKKSEIK